ncbi:MAG TPA: NHL repeat-containing protein [Thermoanaerobaculia bacterium]|nr:NHL repeat-containing protein [Thermoanaerobaculia bacterium]
MSGLERPTGSSSPPRGGRARSLAIIAAVVVVPLVLLLLLFRSRDGGGNRSPAPSGSAPVANAGPPPDEPEDTPRFQDSAAPGRKPFDGMKEPRDAAVDGRGRVWVADFGNSRLRVFDSDGGYLGGWGGRSSGTYGFRDPCAVAIRGDRVYVADTWNGRIQGFTTAGEPKGSASGLFGPRGVGVGEDGRVWVSDTGNNRVTVFDENLANPQSFGSRGNGAGQFFAPVGIAVGPSGNVYVADSGNRRVVVLRKDGGFVRAWPVPGWEHTVEPYVEVDDDENVYVTDPGQANAVLVFDREGRVASRLTAGDDGEALGLPTGLGLDRKNRLLFVVNIVGSRVSRIHLNGQKTP